MFLANLQADLRFVPFTITESPITDEELIVLLRGPASTVTDDPTWTPSPSLPPPLPGRWTTPVAAGTVRPAVYQRDDPNNPWRTPPEEPPAPPTIPAPHETNLNRRRPGILHRLTRGDHP